MHGNEPTGVWALKSVLSQLEGMDPDGFAGEFIALTGNRTALNKSVRCCDIDFNRVWTEARVKALLADEMEMDLSENREQKEFMDLLKPMIEEHDHEVYLIDLHTTSSHSAPFAVIGDTYRNQQFALQLPVPVILGLEEHIDGTLTEYCNELGATTIAFEGGQHQDPNSAILHEALVWMTLEYADCLPDEFVPKEPHPLQVLETAGRHLPAALEVHRRHAIVPEDQFFMNPGFANFDRIDRGEELAHDIHGVITAEMDGRILMPLYQGQGDDGFFIGKEVSPEELQVWLFLRKLEASQLLTSLPGVKFLEEEGRSMRLSKEAQMQIPVKLLRMLGFRKQRQRGDDIVIWRRKHEQD
jgi:succinylglutamate desuccinylase